MPFCASVKTINSTITFPFWQTSSTKYNVNKVIGVTSYFIDFFFDFRSISALIAYNYSMVAFGFEMLLRDICSFYPGFLYVKKLTCYQYKYRWSQDHWLQTRAAHMQLYAERILLIWVITGVTRLTYKRSCSQSDLNLFFTPYNNAKLYIIIQQSIYDLTHQEKWCGWRND